MEPSIEVLARLAKQLAELYPDVASSRRVVAAAGLDATLISFDSRALFNWLSILTNQPAKAQAIRDLALQEFPHQPTLEKVFDPPRPSEPGRLEAVIAESTSIVPMYFYDLALERSRSVALIEFKDSRAMSTGFLIAGNLLITAYFVIPSAQDADQARIRLNFEQDPSGKAEASLQLKLRPRQFFFSSSEAGLTAVRVEGQVNQRWGALEFNPNPPAVGDVVTLIQHPLGRYKAASSGALSNAGEGQIDYLCETAPGSAGAPVFDQNWKVVGMHHGRNEHGGKYGVSARAMMKALGL